jgi:REP element-mobilizing transposase RayT
MLMNPKHHKQRDFKEKQAQHVVLSSCYKIFFNPRSKQIADSLLKTYSAHFKIKIYHRAIVGNHIHLICLAQNRTSLAGFLRVISGQLSQRLKLKGLVPNTSGFWKSRPWSRVLTWGRGYGTAIKYVALNLLEGERKIRRYVYKDEIKVFAALIEEVLSKGLTALPV